MTQKEKIIIRQAITEIMKDEGDFSGAITNLCRLVGWHYSAGELSADLPSTTIRHILKTSTGNKEFKAPK